MTETDFFRLIDNPGSTGLGTAYNEFTTIVVSLCKERESVCRTVFALSYAETELNITMPCRRRTPAAACM